MLCTRETLGMKYWFELRILFGVNTVGSWAFLNRANSSKSVSALLATLRPEARPRVPKMRAVARQSVLIFFQILFLLFFAPRLRWE